MSVPTVLAFGELVLRFGPGVVESFRALFGGRQTIGEDELAAFTVTYERDKSVRRDAYQGTLDRLKAAQAAQDADR